MYDRATTLIIGYLFLAGSSLASSELVFLSEPSPSQAVLEGRPATLECRTSPNLRVHWELKGEPLDISSRRYMVGTDLFIVKALHDQDRGPFTCVITDADTGESVSSRPAFLDITWLDEVVKVKTVGKVPTASGGDLHLSCVADGSEPLQIQWFKNGDGLKTSGKINTTGYDVLVTGVNPLDNGVYRCVASNAASTVHSYNRVSVAVPGEQWAQIIVGPEDVVAKRGSNSKFDCIYQFADVIEWYYKQTGPLENSTKYNILPNGSLVVLNVSENDEGLYSCVGIRGESTEVPQIYSASLRLAYLEDPDDRTLVPLTDGNLRLINEGGDLEVGCNAPAGLPKPAVSWSRGSKGQILSLRGVTKADAGNYTCIITNLADTKYVSFLLAITVEPEITQHPTDLMVDEGGDALFHCEFAGTHKYSSVQWFKDGVPVRGPRYIEKQGFLNITGVLPSDQGAYLCQVLTKPFQPAYSRPAQLTVKEKLKFVPRPINTNLELDTVRKVHCRAQGAAPPVIKWIKDDVEGEGFPEHVSDINGTLHFNKVQSSDKGTYTCIASNYQGIINATIEIDVVVSPKFTNLPSNPTEVFEGEPLMLDCMAEGDPKPAIHWDKNSNMEGFDKTRFKQLENGSLLIEVVQASDEGKYGCTAGNSGGLKRYEVSLIVRGSESYRVSDGNDVNSTLGGSVLSKTVAVTLGAAGAYMVLVIGLMAYCRCRSRKNKTPPSDAQDPVLQAEAGHSGERKVCNGDAGGHSDGDLTAHSHQSQLSSRSYGKLPVTRDHLTDMMVLGGPETDVDGYQVRSKGQAQTPGTATKDYDAFSQRPLPGDGTYLKPPLGPQRPRCQELPRIF
uniref:Tyrosine-protein kinase-like otk n=3 Tax=Lygus hesperus TaxID=30085 RepID=A0A146LW09_LYGHE